MPSREVLLAVAAFLDSAAASLLTSPDKEGRRALAAALFSAAYEDVGKAPRLLDAEDVPVLLRGVAGRLKRRDPLAVDLPAVARAWLEHLRETEVVPHAFELERALEEELEPCAARVLAGENEPVVRSAEAPVVHRAPKLGRNDPCFCGSGRKFKKCHGRP